MRNRAGKALLVGALMVGALAACGDDDEPTTGSTTTNSTTEGGDGSANVLDVEMVDYGYKVEGELRPGLTTIKTRNTGEEFHMMGVGKLKPGKTLADLTAALAKGGPEGGEGEGGDPTAEFIEKELGSPGHILQPGQGQSLTVDLLDEGTYAIICFLPTEGEGAPHFTKGMVSSFEVGKGESAAEAPETDATIDLGDEAEPTGVPTDLTAGEHTFKITVSGSKTKDFIVASVQSGKEFTAFDEFFASVFEKEGGPEKGAAKKAPGTIYASTFEIEPGDSIWVTVDIPAGETYFVGSTNSGNEEDESVDKFVKVNVS